MPAARHRQSRGAQRKVYMEYVSTAGDKVTQQMSAVEQPDLHFEAGHNTLQLAGRQLVKLNEIRRNLFD